AGAASASPGCVPSAAARGWNSGRNGPERRAAGVSYRRPWSGNRVGTVPVRGRSDRFMGRGPVGMGRGVVRFLVAVVAPQVLFRKAPDQGLHRLVDGGGQRGRI